MAAMAVKRRQAYRLPAEVTSFVGRRREVTEVKSLLAESRLVTLVGVGGVGKTRLASRVATEVQRAFPGGVWLVELAALESPELLVETVVEALEIREQSCRPPLRVLVDYLRDRRALLVLDNCEHLLHECALLTETLLRSAPGLRVLATSRQGLGIGSEQTLSVPPLSLPDGDASRRPVTSLARFDAVRLFVERAKAVLPGFALTDANRDSVERICKRLDGIPLAIELAAVRLRALSVEQLLDRLDDRFRLLTGGSRAVLPRHQTLRALIDWSYELCTEQERLLWARASVFAGGLDLEAAEEVCSGEGIEREDVLDLVIGLVDKSVLIREECLSTVRYRLLETVRQYGRERLAASGEEAGLQRRHLDYYLRLSQEACGRVFGPDQVAWFTRLWSEHANLRTALEHCFAEPGQVRAGLRMATDLLYHWITSFYLGEGRCWLDLALAADTEPGPARARALWANAWLAVIQGETGAAAAMLEESRAIGEKLEDDSVLAYVALFSGMVAMNRGDVEDAIGLYEEALARHRAAADPAGTALALVRLSLAHSFRGDCKSAIALGEECLAICDAHGEGWHRSYMTMALGVEVWRQGDTARATELEKESLRFNRSIDDLLGIGMNVEVLAWSAATDSRFRRAARLLGILETTWQAIGAPLSGFGYLDHYHDECRVRTTGALGAPAFREAVEWGARLSQDEAIAYALEERAAPAESSDAAGRSSPLTPRETEIAQLVAQGLSNKEIAAKLVIAQRTAEGHIEHILGKLGFNSRAQIAAWVSEQAHSTETGSPP